MALPDRRVRWLVSVVAAASVYWLAAQLGWALSFVHGTVSSVWPPTGYALALLLLGGRRLWPAILIGEFVANVVHGSAPLPSLAFGIGDSLEAIAGVTLLGLVDFRLQLSRVRDVFSLLMLGALASTVVGATVGTAALILGSGVPVSSAWHVGHIWWLGDATGDLIVVPLLLAFAQPALAGRLHGVRMPHISRVFEALAFTGALALVAVAAQRVPPGLAFVVLPVLLWGALRFEQRGAAVANAVLSAAAVYAAGDATSELARLSLGDRILVTQDFVAIASMTTLVLAAIMSERTRAFDDLRSSEAAATALAAEQAALGRVATAVAHETPAEDLFALVAEEAARLLKAEGAAVLRSAGDHDRMVMGGWARTPGARPAPGSTVPVGALADACTIVNVHGAAWGALCLWDLDDDSEHTDSTPPALARFADLLGLGVGNAEGRATLVARASTDPLTGLANHRAFHERLADELARGSRYRRPVAVAIFDIDRFKTINDAIGHLAGDEVLAEAARRIAAVMRGDSLVARLGGDELAVVLPECDAETAFVAAERARREVAREPIGSAGRVTLSAGVCDNSHAHRVDRLLALADGALYWAKAHGRNNRVNYSPEVVSELSAAERSDRLARSQAQAGLRALARAIDAKDPATTRHSERVAELAALLARTRGWSEPRVELMREAALVHDVGKLGVPDWILAMPAALSEEEYEHVKRHAALGAQIASEILDDEQISWIRWHHERHDGRGYPDGLTGDQLPDGAKLLALADAWEAMTTTRAYSPPKTVEEALDDCVDQAGSQFAPDAVAALLACPEITGPQSRTNLVA